MMAACATPSAGSGPRVDVERVGPASIKLVPRAGQPPFCLVLTVAASGVVRQLTPQKPNESIPCPAGAPIGGVTHRLPPGEGKVKVHVVFSDRKLDGAPIAAQVRELGASASFSAMDLRAPGNLALATLEITPVE